MTILLHIYSWICQWKIFENRSTFGEVMDNIIVPFLTHSVHNNYKYHWTKKLKLNKIKKVKFSLQYKINTITKINVQSKISLAMRILRQSCRSQCSLAIFSVLKQGDFVLARILSFFLFRMLLQFTLALSRPTLSGIAFPNLHFWPRIFQSHILCSHMFSVPFDLYMLRQELTKQKCYSLQFIGSSDSSPQSL